MSGVKYPIIPTLVLLSVRTTDGFREVALLSSGTLEKFKLAAKIGISEFFTNGISPSTPSSNS